MPTKLDSHIVYKTYAGLRVPSVTTILDILAKPALIPWAYNLGKEGKDMRATQDSAMGTGTLLHYLIACHFKEEKPEQSYLDEFSKSQHNYCDNCMLKFYEWTNGKRIVPLFIEKPLVSEVFQYGGTPDLVLEIDGLAVVLYDIKSSNGIYEDYWYQLAGYDGLLKEYTEQFLLIDEYHILRFGKDESLDFEDKKKTNLVEYWEVFRRLREIYEIQKQLRRK